MAKTFSELVQDAQTGIPLLKPAELHRRLQAEPSTLVLDIRDAGDLNLTGIIEGSENVSMGTLYFRADHTLSSEVQAPCLADKNRPIVTTCTLGAVASIAAKTLREYGYTNVSILEGGNVAWREAGLPLKKV
jgi:rhodanese-related sulfurtransferase